MFLAGGCGDGPPAWEPLLQTTAQQTARQNGRVDQPVPMTDELLVYLDTSKSMDGYVSSDGRTVYGTALRELRNVGSLMKKPLRTWVRRVDANVGERLADVELNRASSNRAIYTGTETNLARAIAQFGTPAAIVAGSSSKSAPVAAVHVLVTDGVQSTGTASTAGVDCDSGSDQVCVRAQLTRWLRAGWAGSLLGIRSDFDGVVYSEINHRNPGRPYAIRYKSTRDDVASMRPFYVYVFSPAPAGLAEFTTAFKRRLRAAIPNVVVRELPLSGNFASGAASARVTVPPDAAGISSVEGGRHEDTDRVTIRFDARDARDSAAAPVTFRIRPQWSSSALDMGTPRELARLLTWDVTPIGASADRGRRPELRIDSVRPSDDGTVELRLTPVWPAGTGEQVWAAYTVRGRMTLDADTPPWIQAWSTDMDDAPEYGNRTLFLENAALGIWRSRQGEPETVARILVRMGP
ncbi:MAG TPA: hypothetical protein VE010_14115 [Thermoanaerobaculia bacterium]|nr:hypothetical protein [Thermoanaerobaculia bacterium]